MLSLIPSKPRAGIRVPASIKTPGTSSTPLDPANLNFTTMSVENPLSAGGNWTNNTQGTGGNTAMNAQSSMRVIAAASGGINVAGGDSNGQSPPFDFLDSFAFLPGYSGNQRISATIYVDSGYNPTDNHELELLLGCFSSSGSRTWISCTWDRAGNRLMARMTGPANGFTLMNPTDSGALTGPLSDGDVWKAELYRSSNLIITYKNNVEILRSIAGESALVASASGSGVGIGSYRRTDTPDSAANRYGFRSVVIESF